MRTAHLFAGVGGGILGDLILGHQPVLACEFDPWRCNKLREWFPGTEVVEADVRTIDFRPWNGKVDCLKAGIPCPNWSSARRGMGAPIDYTDETLRIIGEIEPEWVFFECVRNYQREHARLRLALEGLGYTLARPLILDAASLGAGHSRERYWALGHSNKNGKSSLPQYAEMELLPKVQKSPWERKPKNLCLPDGLADARAWVQALGDGQVPLCAAAIRRASSKDGPKYWSNRQT